MGGIVDVLVLPKFHERVSVKLRLVLVAFPAKHIATTLFVHVVLAYLLLNIGKLLEGINWVPRRSKLLLMVLGQFPLVLVNLLAQLLGLLLLMLVAGYALVLLVLLVLAG